MSTDRTCNSSFWTKEEDKIFEDTIAIYSSGHNLLTKMEEALPGKSRDDIINHYKILIEDVEAIESGRVPLPNYTEMQSHSNQKSRFSKTDIQRRRGVAWTEEEHRSFLQGLAKYGRSDWRSISRHCVISRTSSQVASHAQKYFNRLKAVNKENRRASILDITSVGAEAAGTSQVRNTENMIWPAGGGSQAVASTSNESMYFRESTNAEQVTAVAGGESSLHSAAFVNGMNRLYPDENDEFILRIDDLIVEPEDANGSGFLVDAGRSLLPSKQPCTAASAETHSHPITRIGSELEALIAAYMGEGNDITSIFDSGKAPTSHAMLSNAAHSGMCSYPVANIAPQNTVAAHSGMCSYPVASFVANSAPQNTMAAHSGMTNFSVASIGANNAPQNMVAAHSGMTSFAVASIGANNAPQNRGAAHSGMTNFAVASIGANNAPRNTVAAHSGMTNCAVASIGAYNAPQNTVSTHRGMTSFGVASIGAYNAPQTTVAAHRGVTSFGVTSIGAYNAPQTTVAAHRGMTSFGVASIGAYNAPQTSVATHSGMASFAVATFGANNATQNTVAAHSGMTSFAVASIGANNAPRNTASCAVSSIGANNAPQNTGAAHRGMNNFGVGSIGAYNAPQTTVAAHRGMTSFGVASIGAYNSPQTTVAAYSRMASFAVASIGANNAPHNTVADHSGMTSSAVASIGATNATQNTVAAHAQLPPVAPSSNFGGGEWPNLNTTIDDEDIFDLDDLLTDQNVPELVKKRLLMLILVGHN